jgi:hypothetical protein
MATRSPVTTFPFETSLDVAVTTWSGLLTGDDGEPVRLAVYSDRSIQVAGTFGGASVTIGGSNDGETYHALTDTAGDPLTLTTGALKQIVELPIFIKPRVFGGDGTTNLKVILSGRKSI